MFDNIVTSCFLNIELSVCIASFGKETQEVVYFGLSTCSECLDFIPLTLYCVCVGMFSNMLKTWLDLYRLMHFEIIVLTTHYQEF